MKDCSTLIVTRNLPQFQDPVGIVNRGHCKLDIINATKLELRSSRMTATESANCHVGILLGNISG